MLGCPEERWPLRSREVGVEGGGWVGDGVGATVTLTGRILLCDARRCHPYLSFRPS